MAGSSNVKSEKIKTTSCSQWMPGQFEYDGMQFTGYFSAEIFERMKTFDYEDTDIIVVAYPKSGTNWMGEIAWLIANDTDLDQAKARHLHERLYFIDLGSSADILPIDKLATAAPPRVIATHQIRRIFKKPLKETKSKFIVVIRNIKDVVVSYYHFCRAHKAYDKYKGSFDDYFELFRNDQLNQGNWCDWLLDWWQEKDNPNVLFVKYEDMITDLSAEIDRLADFLGKSLSGDAKAALCQYVSFGAMRINPQNNVFGKPDVMDYDISPFIRKGQVGDWKNYFNKEQSDYVDRMYDERIKGTGITVQFE